MNSNIDLTVITSVIMADGIGRQGIGLLSAVHDSLSANAYQLSSRGFKDIPPEVLKILIKPFDGFGKVSFWTSILGVNQEWIPVHQAIDSKFKIAYAMFESDALPDMWVSILNSFYDIVVVPDPSLVPIFKNSGVKIPIFMIPLGIFIDDLLNVPFKETVGTPFTFGMSAGFWKRKNHAKLVKAFKDEFGNDPKFKLKIHGRFGPYKNEVEKAVKDADMSNIEFLCSALSVKDYNSFMEEIDCYVFPSMGEGFSITPRETMALGKPCIVTDNTSQHTICASGHVIPLAANKRIQAVFESLGNKTIGCFYDCDTDELGSLMRNVVDNYDKYLQQARGGREWVKQFRWETLKPVYLKLLKPENVILGNTNVVDKHSFQTNSKTLFEKLRNF